MSVAVLRSYLETAYDRQITEETLRLSRLMDQLQMERFESANAPEKRAV